MNINKTLLVSTLLHAGFFAAAVLFSAKVIKPLPLGVELAYDAAPSIPKSVPASSASAVLKKVTAPAVIEKDDITTKAKEVVPVAVEPQAPAVVGSVAQSEALSGREGVVTGSEVSPEDRYLYELKKLLERRKNYPLMARKMGHTGTVTMRFTLKPDGTLAGSEVVGKAPYESLNQAAVTLVEGINGMKPFPQEIRKDSWSITVPIEYTLK